MRTHQPDELQTLSHESRQPKIIRSAITLKPKDFHHDHIKTTLRPTKPFFVSCRPIFFFLAPFLTTKKPHKNRFSQGVLGTKLACLRNNPMYSID